MQQSDSYNRLTTRRYYHEVSSLTFTCVWKTVRPITSFRTCILRRSRTSLFRTCDFRTKRFEHRCTAEISGKLHNTREKVKNYIDHTPNHMYYSVSSLWMCDHLCCLKGIYYKITCRYPIYSPHKCLSEQICLQIALVLKLVGRAYWCRYFFTIILIILDY